MHHTNAEIFAFVLLDIGVIVIFARLFGRIAVKLGQPPVIGEIIAGIALGPSLLGLLPGDPDKALFPNDVVPQLKIIAQLGLVLFMFLVGLELDRVLLRGRGRIAGAISLTSIIAPFGLGALLALLLYPQHSTVAGHEVSKLAMVLFLGVAMSITAFPVLARILSDRNLYRTSVGAFALASAAIDDILAWTLLALVVAVVNGQNGTEVVRIVALTAAFALFMYTIGQRLAALLESWYKRAGKLTPDLLSVILVGALASAWTTDRIGIHAIFGAFVFGTILPRHSEFVADIRGRLEQISMLLLLPLFFVVTGFDVNIGGLSAGGWAQLALILAVAISGKVGGAYVGARLSRLSHRHSLAIAVLINTRGLTELVILSIGKELGVLDGDMFTMMVLMALITTAMAGPLLEFIYPPKYIIRDTELEEQAAAAKSGTAAEQALEGEAPSTTTTERDSLTG